MSDLSSATTPAVLVLACRRPASTERLLQFLQAAGLRDIHVAVDGPKATAADARLVDLTRQVVRRFKLPNDNLLVRDTNRGGPQGVPEAIDWFFTRNDRGIIIEDDLMPQPSFIRFCAELLVRYENDPRVAAVHGWSSQLAPPPHSYFFSRYAPGWGWATWASRWKDFDRASRLWRDTDHDEVLRRVADGDPSFVRYWSEILNRVYVEGDSNWDYRWTYTNFVLGRLTATASVNLVENTGFGDDATHTRGRPFYLLPPAAMSFPLSHPLEVIADRNADQDRHRAGFLGTFSMRFRYGLNAMVRYFGADTAPGGR